MVMVTMMDITTVSMIYGYGIEEGIEQLFDNDNDRNIKNNTNRIKR